MKNSEELILDLAEEIFVNDHDTGVVLVLFTRDLIDEQELKERLFFLKETAREQATRRVEGPRDTSEDGDLIRDQEIEDRICGAV